MLAFWQSRKIRTKILLALVPMAVLFLMIIAISFQSARSASLNHFHKTMSMILQYGAQDMNRFVLSSYQSFRKIAQYDIYGLAIEFSPMQELFDHFKQLRQDFPVFRQIVLTDIHGDILCATDPELVGQRIALQDILISPNPIAVQYAPMLQPSDKPAITQNTFVFRSICKNYKGDVNGVLFAYLDWSKVESLIDQLYAGLQRFAFTDARIALLDVADKTVLSLSQGSRYMLHLDDTFMDWLSVQAHEGNLRTFPMERHQVYTAFINLVNPTSLGQALRMDSTQNDLRLVFFVPQRTVLAQANRTLILNVILALGGMAVVILLMLFISGRIADPLQKAVQFAQSVANRDFSQKLNLRSDDEIGQLGRALDSMLETLKAVTKQANAIAQGTYTFELTPLNEKDELGRALQTMTKSLSDASQAVQKVADGDLSIRVTEKSREDLLAISINSMINTLKNVARQANTIALGDFSADIEPRSDKDELGIALQTMTQTLKYVTSQAIRIAGGDYQSELMPQSDKDELGRAIQTMTQRLREVSLANERSYWFKTGQTKLSDIMLGETDMGTLCKNILNFLSHYLNAQLGTFYLTQDDDSLRLTASFGLSGWHQTTPVTQPGQGMVGEAFRGRQTIVVTELPQDYMQINSSLGHAVPKNLIAVPIIRHETVKGVIELGSFTRFEDFQIDFINLVAKNIAIAIQAAQDSETTHVLLEKSRQQAEELQLKQQELQEKNTKLEEHTLALRISEETLKVQHEELQATNFELAENSRLLERQKQEIGSAKSMIEQKVRELENAYQYKSDFLANMSHELRTPLTSLLILAKLLANNEEGNLSPEQQEYAAVILRSGNDLLNHINDILDLSKAETKKLSLSFQKIPLNLLLKNIRNQFNPVAQEKGLEFIIEQAPGLESHFHSDMQRVEQILRNLLSNAFKFTRQGNVTLRVYYPESRVALQNPELSDQRTIAFCVRDTGIGIPRDKQEIIFEAFQQADGSTSRRFGGTGLGLTISREFAQLLGGELHLESAHNQGSAFTLYLPFHPADIGEAPNYEPLGTAPDPHAASAATDAWVMADKKRLLIIEDDRNFANILSNMGTQRGYDCLIAPDGATGIRMLRDHDIHAVVLDIGLPDMDGYQVLKAIHDMPNKRDIPVQILSGRDKQGTGLPVGVLDFFQKPITMEAMGSLFSNFEALLRPQPADDIFADKRILLVDDDTRNTYALASLLRQKGMQPLIADSGQAALDILSRGDEVDLILMDIMMPILDGHATIKAIRQQPRFHALPIIALTAKALKKDRDDCLASGANDYLAKPVDEARLFTMMRVWLKQTSQPHVGQLRMN